MGNFPTRTDGSGFLSSLIPAALTLLFVFFMTNDRLASMHAAQQGKVQVRKE
ncbi:hypothetical protein HT574_03655 [Parageobacillus sp. VR-IP]|uniref:hypothetical protein n=1 Tax=Parageobacillus sp. VR-IP TaxID=2742205 RepID=UPI001583FE04|nr:hypothetical protein [Parageobacillus sp. VR-IP]NUK29228.1 hypothetical protein [Parageobacillus sp. VR-IP]